MKWLIRLEKPCCSRRNHQQRLQLTPDSFSACQCWKCRLCWLFKTYFLSASALCCYIPVSMMLVLVDSYSNESIFSQDCSFEWQGIHIVTCITGVLAIYCSHQKWKLWNSHFKLQRKNIKHIGQEFTAWNQNFFSLWPCLVAWKSVRSVLLLQYKPTRIVTT